MSLSIERGGTSDAKDGLVTVTGVLGFPADGCGPGCICAKNGFELSNPSYGSLLLVISAELILSPSNSRVLIRK